MLEITTLFGQPQFGAKLMGFHDDDFMASNNFVDSLFEQNELSSSSYSNNNSTSYLEQRSNYYHADFLPYNNESYNYPTDDQLLCLPPGDILISIEKDFQQTKRQKIDCSELHYSDIMFEVEHAACSYQCPEGFLSAQTHQQIQTPLPAVYSIAKESSSGDGIGNGNGGLSAQSVAARKRRRKISEKTQELGKLIPGGNKMNTAEMFHAASKYVKFMQAQIGLLKLMESKANENSLHSEEVEVLLASSTIQEKLYSEEKCLASQELVAVLSKEPQLQSSPLSKEIDLMNGSKEELVLTETATKH